MQMQQFPFDEKSSLNGFYKTNKQKLCFLFSDTYASHDPESYEKY